MVQSSDRGSHVRMRHCRSRIVYMRKARYLILRYFIFVYCWVLGGWYYFLTFLPLLAEVIPSI